MAKKRVSDIATEANLPPKEVVEKLQKAGLSVKAPTSSVDETEAKRILGVGAAPARRPRARAADPVVPGREPAGRGRQGARDGRGGRAARPGQRGARPDGRPQQAGAGPRAGGQGAAGPQARSGAGG